MDTLPRLDIERIPRPEEVVVPGIETIASLLGPRYGEVLREWFPDVDPPTYPTGTNILVQLRTEAKKKTMANGKVFYYPDETVDANKARAQTGIVRALGPAAYRNRQTLALWPEGHWCVPGMFIRCPMYGGDRLQVDYDRVETDSLGRTITVSDFVLFATFRDQDCIGLIRVDPILVKTS